jgi:hypothetical protein
MHTFVMSVPRVQLLYRHLPLFFVSLLIAEASRRPVFTETLGLDQNCVRFSRCQDST